MRMRMKLGKLLSALLLTGLFASCAESRLQPSVFTVNRYSQNSSLSLPPEGSVATVVVESDLEWSAQMKSGEWISVSSITSKETQEGLINGTVSLKCKTNPSESERIDTLIVTAGKAVIKMAMKQKPLLSAVSHQEIRLTGTEPVRVALSFHGKWTASAQADWFTVSPSSGEGNETLEVEAVDGNINVGDRNSELMITVDGASLKIPVSQGQTDVILIDGENEVELPCEGGSFVIRTQSNVDYRILVDDDWVTPSATKALNERDEAFTAAPNEGFQPRSTVIRFIADNFGETYSVVQLGMDPILKETAWGFYGIEGGDIRYEPLTDQVSRLYSDGKETFRLLHPGDRCVHVLSGIPENLRAGDAFQVSCFKVDTDYGQSERVSHTVSVVKTDGETAWLKETDQVFFVVKL